MQTHRWRDGDNKGKGITRKAASVGRTRHREAGWIRALDNPRVSPVGFHVRIH